MEQTTEQLLDMALKLFDQKDSAGTIALLPDEILAQHNNAILYTWRGLAYGASNQPDQSIADYSKAIDIDKKYTIAYFNRGLAWYDKKEYDKAIDDYTIAIATDKNYKIAYYNRGLAYYYKEDYDNAIKDFTEATNLDPGYLDAFINLGLAYYNKHNESSAIDNYTRAIQINNKEKNAYYNRGLAWYSAQDYDSAIKDYTAAINLDATYAFAYYNRAIAYSQKSDGIANAIGDYEQYIRLANNPDDYWTAIARSAIKELSNRTATDPTSNSIPEIVAKIKKLLLFQDECITHYTGLSAAKAMILSDTGSSFRLSEGSFLNDPSEGRVLSGFLNFSGVIAKEDATLAKLFGEKPFIGSFVNDTLSDDLTLWRMYGKEDRNEAKGCSVTMNKNIFLAKLKDKLGINQDTAATASGNSGSSIGNNMQTDSQFTFYKVAYITKDVNRPFIIPGSEANEKELTDFLDQLKTEIVKLGNTDPTPEIKKNINSIAYLFKSVDYQYEKEVRLIVNGTGFDKKVDISSIVPKVYIELIDITSVVSRVTLGPKVESAEEWAAAFYYQIQKKTKNPTVNVVISHLPFK